jgi:hypothetical protein
MIGAANEDWPEGQVVVVPHAWRGDSLWHEMQTETQDRIGAALRAMYADLLQQPLSPRMVKLAREIEMQHEPSRHAD